MLEDISANPRILGQQDELGVTEFIKGKRISVHVTENSIDIQQDVEFNEREWGRAFTQVELEQWWDTLGKVYRLDEFKLRNTFLGAYVISCIVWDEKMMKGHPQSYPPKGLIVVEVLPEHGTTLPVDKLQDFCSTVGLPFNKPLMKGPSTRIVEKLQEMRTVSEFSLNAVPAGLVIVNQPAEKLEDGSIQRWFISPDIEVALEMDSEDIGAMVTELIMTTFANPEFIEDMYKNYDVDPSSHRTKFRNILYNVLIEDFAATYDEYMRRCYFFLKQQSPNDPSALFEKKVRAALLKFIDNFVMQMTMFRHRTRV